MDTALCGDDFGCCHAIAFVSNCALCFVTFVVPQYSILRILLMLTAQDLCPKARQAAARVRYWKAGKRSSENRDDIMTQNTAVCSCFRQAAPSHDWRGVCNFGRQQQSITFFPSCSNGTCALRQQHSSSTGVVRAALNVASFPLRVQFLLRIMSATLSPSRLRVCVQQPLDVQMILGHPQAIIPIS